MEQKDKDYIDGYATEKRKARRKGVGATNEFFTPELLVKKMCNKLPEDTWSNFSKTILEPSFGNGAFLIECLNRRLSFCHSINDIIKAISTIYGVELMQDNVNECHQRLLDRIIEFTKENNISINSKNIDKIQKIFKDNLVCSDFFKWDFDNWCYLEKTENKSNPLPLF